MVSQPTQCRSAITKNAMNATVWSTSEVIEPTQTIIFSTAAEIGGTAGFSEEVACAMAAACGAVGDGCMTVRPGRWTNVPEAHKAPAGQAGHGSICRENQARNWVLTHFSRTMEQGPVDMAAFGQRRHS